jgi:hypothetical protein
MTRYGLHWHLVSPVLKRCLAPGDFLLRPPLLTCLSAPPRAECLDRPLTEALTAIRHRVSSGGHQPEAVRLKGERKILLRRWCVFPAAHRWRSTAEFREDSLR